MFEIKARSYIHHTFPLYHLTNEPNKLEGLLRASPAKCNIQHASLLGPFMSYKGNEVLWIRPLEPYLQHFIFFITYKGDH